MVVALFMMHGAIYAVMKTEGALYEKTASVGQPHDHFFYLMLFGRYDGHASLRPAHDRIDQGAPCFLCGRLPRYARDREYSPGDRPRQRFRAFLSSCAAIVALMMLSGSACTRNLVYSFPNPEYSLTVHNAASFRQNPLDHADHRGNRRAFGAGYTVSIYWVFRGKVKLTT